MASIHDQDGPLPPNAMRAPNGDMFYPDDPEDAELFARDHGAVWCAGKPPEWLPLPPVYVPREFRPDWTLEDIGLDPGQIAAVMGPHVERIELPPAAMVWAAGVDHPLAIRPGTVLVPPHPVPATLLWETGGRFVHGRSPWTEAELEASTANADPEWRDRTMRAHGYA